MIDLTKNFEDMKKEIIFLKYVLDESISPEKNPEKFTGFDGLDYLSKNNLLMQNARCLSWKYFSQSLDLLGEGNWFLRCFNELQYNACMHGNKWDKTLPISFKLGVGKRGLIGQVIDSGNGFDYKSIFEKFNKREIYSLNKGSGFRAFNDFAGCIVSWEGNGNIADVMMKVGRIDLDLWSDYLRNFNNSYKSKLS